MKLRNFNIDNNEPMTLMGGMNVLESRDLAMQVAERFKELPKN
jgi:2-dehydro-3-deoxyphosphooctonate aldolase (KDO 8-P synthase)